MCVFENSKTFSGALSSGFKTILVPVEGQISTLSLGSVDVSSEFEELPDVTLETVPGSVLLELLSGMPNSLETKAARTSGGSVLHASRMEAESVAVGFRTASSLNCRELKARLKHAKIGAMQQTIQA